MRYSLLSLSLGALLAGPLAAAPRDIMVVMDASGSMWGQVDGRAKIEIARDVFADLARDWGARDQSAGLIAYGHRRRGDCGDIELIAPIAPGSAARLGEFVSALVPRGKTPLSAAVRMAAEEMKLTEEAATVVLLTDGIETCDADPCALGRELEQLGIDFTTHVIGFDIADAGDRAQLQCLAEETGGRYFDAQDAGGLGAALGSVSEPEPAAPEPPAMITQRVALRYDETAVRPADVLLQIRNPETGEVTEIARLSGADQIINGAELTMPAGRWTLLAEGDGGRGELSVDLPGDQETVYIPFAAALPGAIIRDMGPYQIGVEHRIFVRTEGSAQSSAEFELAAYALDGPQAGQSISSTYVFGSDIPGDHQLAFTPPSAGRFEVRLKALAGDAEIARQQIEARDGLTPSWDGARSGPAGGRLPIALGGGHLYYYSTLILTDAAGQQVRALRVEEFDQPEIDFALPLPETPGEYTLSYHYSDAAGEQQVADLGTITVTDAAGAPTPRADDADSVAPPAGTDLGDQGADAGQSGDTMQALGAAAHGSEPVPPAATAEAASAAHADTMGEDAPGALPGALQGNWQVTDMQSGAPLMRWQIVQDEGASAAFLDLTGLPGTAFEGVQGRFDATGSLAVVGTGRTGPEAFQIDKTLPQGKLSGMLTRPGDWDGQSDKFTGMVQLTGPERQAVAMIELARIPALTAAPAGVPKITYHVDIPDGNADAIVEITDQEGQLVSGWLVVENGNNFVELPEGGTYTATLTSVDGTKAQLALSRSLEGGE